MLFNDLQSNSESYKFGACFKDGEKKDQREILR